MNLYPFRFFFPQSWWGESYHFIRELKKHRPFRWTHFDVVISDKKADKTILCFAQIHTVSRGKLSWFTAKRIAKTQARLFTLYSDLWEKKVVAAFGVEGLTDIHGDEHFTFNRKPLQNLLTDKEKELLHKKGKDYKTVKKIFYRLGKKWHQTLKNHPHTPEKVAPSAALIDGVRMLSFLEPNLRIYPIEGEKEYQYVNKKIHRLQDKIIHAERRAPYIRAKNKGFKKLSREEYDAVLERNKVVQQFNTILKAPLREEAHIKLAMRQLKTQDLTAFVMGVGHRKNLIKEAKHLLNGKNIGFVFIIPQELWIWKAVIKWLKIGLFVGIPLGIYLWWKLA